MDKKIFIVLPLVLIFVTCYFIIFLNVFRLDNPKIEEIYPSELLVEPNSISYIRVEIKNYGFGVAKEFPINITGLDLKLHNENEMELLPFQTGTLLIKVIVPAHTKSGIYTTRLILPPDKEGTKYRVVVENRENLMTYRYNKLKNSLQYIKILGLSEKEKEKIEEVENLLNETATKISEKDYASAEDYMDQIEIILDSIKEKEIQKTEIPLEIIVGIVVLISFITLLWIFRPHIKVPTISFKRSHKPVIKSERLLEKTEKPKEVKEEKPSQEKKSSPLKNKMLQLIEEQYRAGLLSEKTYEELKKKYGG